MAIFRAASANSTNKRHRDTLGSGAKDPAATPIVLRGRDWLVGAMAISPDSRWVVTGSCDKTARLWLLQMNDLVDLARTTPGEIPQFTQECGSPN
jgi:WD40 repeat protein